MGTIANTDLAGSGSFERNDAGTFGKSGTRLTQPVRQTFITDDELRAAGVSELDIDRLNRHPATQKPDGKDVRDWEAVERLLGMQGTSEASH